MQSHKIYMSGLWSGWPAPPPFAAAGMFFWLMHGLNGTTLGTACRFVHRIAASKKWPAA